MIKALIATPIYKQARKEMLAARDAIRDTSKASVGMITVRGMSDLTRARNTLVEMAMDDAAVTHVLFMDDDISCDGAVLDILLAHDEPFIGGMVGGDNNGHNCGNVRQPDSRGLREVDMLGGAFMLIRRDAFEAMSTPDIQYRTGFAYFMPMIHAGEYLSEDYAICQRWRDTGGKIYIDPATKLVHHQGKYTYHTPEHVL